MASAFRLTYRVTLLALSASCWVACGGSATENATTTGGATGADGGSTQSAGGGGASSSAGASGRTNGGASSGGASSGGASHGGASNGGASSGGAAGSGGLSQSCQQAKDGYAALVTSLLAESSNESCVVGTDCQYLPTSDCGNDCSISVASRAASPTITSQLAAFAATNCADCAFPELPCPALPVPATQCTAGQCR